MPAVNIRIELYKRAIRAGIDNLAPVVNELLEEHLNELENGEQ